MVGDRGDGERTLLEEQGQRKHICPECGPSVELPTLEALGVHIERHSPVGPAIFHPRTNARLSGACARGCGRHFGLKCDSYARVHHEKVCDGSTPLPPKTGPIVRAIAHCPKCGTVATKLPFDGYGALWRCTKGGCGHEFRMVAGRVIGEHETAPKPEPEVPPPAATEPPAAKRSYVHWSKPDPAPQPQPAPDVREGPPPPQSIPESKPQPPEREENPMPKNEPLPPLSEAGPCRRGCGRELGASAGPRAKHENRCDGTPKDGATASARKTAKARPQGSADKGGKSDEWVEMTLARAKKLRDEAELMRKEADRREAQAKRLEEVAEDLGATF